MFEKKVHKLWCDYQKERHAFLRGKLEELAQYLAKEGKCSLEIQIELYRYLVREARSNGSTWSGGYNPTNMEEQVCREAALSLADDYAAQSIASQAVKAAENATPSK